MRWAVAVLVAFVALGCHSEASPRVYTGGRQLEEVYANDRKTLHLENHEEAAKSSEESVESEQAKGAHFLSRKGILYNVIKLLAKLDDASNESSDESTVTNKEVERFQKEEEEDSDEMADTKYEERKAEDDGNGDDEDSSVHEEHTVVQSIPESEESEEIAGTEYETLRSKRAPQYFSLEMSRLYDKIQSEITDGSHDLERF